jgi:hypothetical protein
MTGPEHYCEAEKDIDRANEESIADGFAQFIIERAQVHATLALAAATLAVTERCGSAALTIGNG